MLNFSLTPEQLELQKRAREFALNELLPVAWYFDEKNETPLFVLKKAFEAGLMNTDIPEKYGGKGYGMLESILLTEEISAACTGFATSLFDNSLGMEPLILSDNNPLKEKYLHQFSKEFKLICFATSEPGMGSDVSGIRCEAREDGNDYILNGTKYWITNGGIADYVSVFATVDPKSQHEGICAFFVEMDWEGVSKGR
ncbi:MAG: acyl-CoA dehydrogenase family protein, partial [Deltaproteobacteria bacterium]|nr:acyl-CoA dehydrogenase family protein [Deltaproteobacteria bacterium]